MATTRTVKFERVKKSPFGEWNLSCKDCPLTPHLVALGMKSRECLAGITTNIQGLVVMKKCEHFEEESLNVGARKKATIECKKVDE